MPCVREAEELCGVLAAVGVHQVQGAQCQDGRRGGSSFAGKPDETVRVAPGVTVCLPAAEAPRVRAGEEPVRRSSRGGGLSIGEQSQRYRSAILVAVGKNALAFLVEREPTVGKTLKNLVRHRRMVAREHAVGVQRLDRAEKSGARMLVFAVLLRVVAEFTRLDERGGAGVARRQPHRDVLLTAETAEIGREQTLLLRLCVWRKTLRVKFDGALAGAFKSREDLAGTADELVQLECKRRLVVVPFRRVDGDEKSAQGRFRYFKRTRGVLDELLRRLIQGDGLCALKFSVLRVPRNAEVVFHPDGKRIVPERLKVCPLGGRLHTGGQRGLDRRLGDLSRRIFKFFENDLLGGDVGIAISLTRPAPLRSGGQPWSRPRTLWRTCRCRGGCRRSAAHGFA